MRLYRRPTVSFVIAYVRFLTELLSKEPPYRLFMIYLPFFSRFVRILSTFSDTSPMTWRPYSTAVVIPSTSKLSLISADSILISTNSALTTVTVMMIVFRK